MTVKEAMKSVSSPSGFNEKYRLEDILTDEFIRTVTDCADADELFADIEFDGQHSFDNMDVAVLDNIIAKHSLQISTFIEFIQCAVNQHYRQS